MEFYYDEIDEDILVIAADGGLNAETASQFVDQIESLVDAGLRRIVVDCSRLSFVSSAGLGRLVRIHGKMKSRGGDVKIAAVPGVLAQVLQVTRLNTLFQIYPDVSRARLSWRPLSE